MDGAALRDASLAEVDEHANEDWKQAVWEVITGFPKGQEVTTDDIWSQLDSLGVSTPEHRAMGGLMMRAVRRGVLVNTGKAVHSRRAVCHKRPIWVYRVAA